MAQQPPEILYHVSPHKNRDGILKVGLDPAQSLCRRTAVYAVPRSKLVWAVAHCSMRHNISVRKIDIWRIDWTGLFRLHNNDLWYSFHGVGATLDLSVIALLTENGDCE